MVEQGDVTEKKLSAGQMLWYSFDHEDNSKNFPEYAEVPASIKLEASLEDVAAWCPPEDAVNFQLTDTTQRLIFYIHCTDGRQVTDGQSKWLPLEQDHLDRFEEYLAEKEVNEIPDWFPEEEKLRMLHGDNWVYDDAYRSIISSIAWRATNLPIKLNDAQMALLKSGMFHIFGRDRNYRPILVVKPLVLNKIGYKVDNNDLLIACSYMMFYVKTHMMQEGKVENQLTLFDLEFAQPWSLPVKSLNAFQKTISSQFRCSSSRIIVLNACKAFVLGWAVMSRMLNEVQRRKTFLHGTNTCEELREGVHPCQLLKEYGGTAETPEYYWPPTIPRIV